MSTAANAPSRWPKRSHIVRKVHTGAKYLLSNFDAFHPPAPKYQERRLQPQRAANGHHDAEFVSTTPVQPRQSPKKMNRVLRVDILERHMDICLAWEGETLLDLTTYRKPARSTIYLKICRTTQWNDGFATSTAMFEPLLDTFQSTARGEQWKIDVLRVVYREDDQAWWHVQERMWRDRLRDPFKVGWKVLEQVEQVTKRASSIGETAGAIQECSKRKIPWSNEPVEGVLQPAAKRKRRLPWVTDQSLQKGRKSGGAKVNAQKAKQPWNPGVDSVSNRFRSRREIDPYDDNEEIVVVKMEGGHAAIRNANERDGA
ncbi:uncharacterized protein RCC_08324 [Ramularia collo-cygni]|uniref:Uncharacterized protein n=1 Tax=Ramularia collo-cygni TaxID=112498 RepID=A0A2D3VHJ6_9PEZI|nr:uncharacterized protein RCC_08324 [Ramularia collo-cygni]CZT22454.1 uncharacterized protein RCC_08324 [Ramularia collo-cygni]